MNIYLITYEKESPLFGIGMQVNKYRIICKNENEVIYKIKNIYSKHEIIYPRNLKIENIWLSEDELKKLKE